MSTIKSKKSLAISVEILHRNGQVTFATNKGDSVTVRCNDLKVALGVVLAKSVASLDDWCTTQAKNFDINVEIKMY